MAKKETKHQRGLLAITKKQLATREAERAKVAKELEEAQQEAQVTLDELQTTETEIAKAPEDGAYSPEVTTLERNDSTLLTEYIKSKPARHSCLVTGGSHHSTT